VGLCILFTSLMQILHRKKRFTSFPSPAGMSLTKLPLCRHNSVMTSLFPPRDSLVVTSRLGTGNSRTFFYGVASLMLLASLLLCFSCCIVPAAANILVASAVPNFCKASLLLLTCCTGTMQPCSYCIDTMYILMAQVVKILCIRIENTLAE
jgi:hypothetical protein